VVPGDDPRSRIAHLFRRAAFGARPEELDAAVAAGYEATVDTLVDLSVADAAVLPAPAFSPPYLVGQAPADPGPGGRPSRPSSGPIGRRDGA